MPTIMKTMSPVLVFVILIAGMSCSKKDDTVLIRKVIANGAQLAQEHQIGDLLRLATEDFSASPGNHDARSVKGILFVAFQHYGTFAVHYPRPSVDVAEGGESAKAKFQFIIISQDRTIPGLKELYDDPQKWIETASEKADLYQLDLGFVKAKGDWLVKTAHMEGFKGWGF